MAEASRSHPSRYVRLTKDQDASASGPGVEDIRPGELNLPVAVLQLEQRKCFECGQVLPESHRAPADEPWTTGIFGCAEDPESCRTGLFCPCVLFGRNVQALREDIPWTRPCTCHAVCVEGGIALAILTAIFHGVDPNTSVLIGEGLVFSWWLCSIYTGNFPQQLQRRYHLEVFDKVNSREMEKINVFSGMFSSWIISAVVGTIVGFQVILVELLGTFAGTVHLNGRLWLMSVLIGSVSLVIGTILKCIPFGSGDASSDRHDQPIPTGPSAV